MNLYKERGIDHFFRLDLLNFGCTIPITVWALFSFNLEHLKTQVIQRKLTLQRKDLL